MEIPILRTANIGEKKQLVLSARSLGETIERLQVALVMKNGAAFGEIVELKPEVKEILINLDELEPVRTVTLPRPYPGFLPYYLTRSLPVLQMMKKEFYCQDGLLKVISSRQETKMVPLDTISSTKISAAIKLPLKDFLINLIRNSGITQN